jgi:ADP-ribose pyrophosphatase YjhB (NUDIX family)
MPSNLECLTWLTRLQAIAQNGLAYCKDSFDRERYEELTHIVAEMIAKASRIDKIQALNILMHEAGYTTPKVDVRGVVFQDNKILLVQEKADGKWSLPGGWADVGYSPAEAVVKEIFEESGYQAKAVKLLALYDMRKQKHPFYLHHVYKIFFLCEIIGGSPTTSNETLAIDFFAKDALPELSSSRVKPQQILHFFDHFQHPEWPTDFD